MQFLSRGLVLSVVAAVSLESWNKKANKINFYSSGGNETKASSTQIDSRAKLSHEVTLQWSLFPDKTGVLLFTPRSNEKCWRQIASRLKQIFYGLNWNNDRIQKRFNCDWGLYAWNIRLGLQKSFHLGSVCSNLFCKLYEILSQLVYQFSVLQVMTKSTPIAESPPHTLILEQLSYQFEFSSTPATLSTITTLVITKSVTLPLNTFPDVDTVLWPTNPPHHQLFSSTLVA